MFISDLGAMIMASFEEDYKFWQVVDPGKFLPLFIVILAVSVLIVHGFVVSSAKYNFLAAPAAAK